MKHSCENCKYKSKSKSEVPCSECKQNRATDRFESMTNADYIRNMSDEELADAIMIHQSDVIYGSIWTNASCLEWLQQVKEIEGETEDG